VSYGALTGLAESMATPHPGRCPGLSYSSLSGSWLLRFFPCLSISARRLARAVGQPVLARIVEDTTRREADRGTLWPPIFTRAPGRPHGKVSELRRESASDRQSQTGEWQKFSPSRRLGYRLWQAACPPMLTQVEITL